MSDPNPTEARQAWRGVTGGRSSLLRRLLSLEGKQSARQDSAALLAYKALFDEAQGLLAALPDAERAQVEARGARGVADLIAASWQLVREGEDRAHLARRAYRMAFEGGDA